MTIARERDSVRRYDPRPAEGGKPAQAIRDAFGLPGSPVVSFLPDIGYPARQSANRHTTGKPMPETVQEL